MKRCDYQISGQKQIKIHLNHVKQPQNRKQERQCLPLDNKASSSLKSHWSHIPVVSVNKVSINQSGNSGDSSRRKFVNGSHKQTETLDDVTKDACQLDEPLLIDGKSPTISLGKLESSSNQEYNSYYEHKKLIFDDQDLAKKEKSANLKALLRQYSPTVSLKKLPLSGLPNDNSKDKLDVDLKEVEEDALVMRSKSRRNLHRNRLPSKVTVKGSSQRDSSIDRSWLSKTRTRNRGSRVEPDCIESKHTNIQPVSPIISDVRNRSGSVQRHHDSSVESKHATRAVCPIIHDADVANRGLGRNSHDRCQTRGERLLPQAKKKVEVTSLRKFGKIAQNAKIKALVKRQKLENANANKRNKSQSLFSKEDGSSVIWEDDEKDVKCIQHNTEMSTISGDNSVSKNENLHKEGMVGVCDTKRSDVLDKYRNLKELEERRELTPSDATESGTKEQYSLDKHKEKLNGSGGENPKSKDKNPGTSHELVNLRVVIRPFKRKSRRRMLSNQIAALFMTCDKPKTRNLVDHSEITDCNSFKNKVFVEHGQRNEISGSSKDTLTDRSMLKTTEKFFGNTEGKMTEKKCNGTMTEENGERLQKRKNNFSEGKLEEGVPWRNVDWDVNGPESVGKTPEETNSQGGSKIIGKDEILGTREDSAVTVEDSVKSVRKLQTGSTFHKRKCPPDETGQFDLEGASKYFRREEEVDSVSTFLAGNSNEEKENDHGVRCSSHKVVTPTEIGVLSLSKLEKSKSLSGNANETKDETHTDPEKNLTLKLKEIIERASNGKCQGERNFNSTQMSSGPGSFVGNKGVGLKNLTDNVNGEMETLPAEKQKSSFTSVNGSNIVKNGSVGEDSPDSGTCDIPPQCKDNTALSLQQSPKGDQNDLDGDIVLDFIKSPQSVSSQQILMFMNEFFQTDDATNVPSPEDILQKLSETFGQNMNRWRSFVKHHWELKISSRVGTVSSSAQEKPIVTVGKYSLTKTDMDSLENASWLNDNIINSYLHLLSKEAPLKNASFSSFFFQVYQKNGFEHVQRWHRKIDIFACRLILVPIHSRHHWCLVAVDNKEKTIIFYDSMRSGGMRYLMKIKAYMNEEVIARQRDPIEWVLQSKEGIPKQRNTSDCGVFVCQYAKRLCYDKQVTFSHSEATHFRQLMKQELITQKLQPP